MEIALFLMLSGILALIIGMEIVLSTKIRMIWCYLVITYGICAIICSIGAVSSMITESQ